MAKEIEKSCHLSPHMIIAAGESVVATIPSAAAALVAIESSDAGRILRASTPEQVKKRIASTKKRKGPSILRDAWLSPLTLNERSPVGRQSRKSGVRASDKGFLSLDLKDYLKRLD